MGKKRLEQDEAQVGDPLSTARFETEDTDMLRSPRFEREGTAG
jgi:hypothetical protein